MAESVNMPPLQDEASPGFRKKIDADYETVHKANSNASLKDDRKNYTAEKAANHLRRKLNKVKDKLFTVDEFIDNVASASSLSREPYRIIKPNGETVETRIYLRELLQEIN
jgi:hypothetical protein